MDIKMSPEVTNKSTCFLKSSSVMTSRALLAVALAIPIISSSYVDALKESLPSLETGNFDAMFPDPVLFTVDPKLVPDARRRELYLGKTFIFWDKDQFNQILPLIEASGGNGVLQSDAEGPLTVKSIAAFIQQTAIGAVGDFGNKEKAVLSGSIIPVKLLIETPDVSATELLVKINKATKALGICLMDQHLFSESIKTMNTKHMFRLRPVGPLPELLKAPESPAVKSKRSDAAKTSSKITDFFALAPTPGSRNTSHESSGSNRSFSANSSEGTKHSQTTQIPRITKPATIVPKLENPFFQSTQSQIPSAIMAESKRIPPKKPTGSFVAKDKGKTQVQTSANGESQNIFTFFTQGGTALPAPRRTSPSQNLHVGESSAESETAAEGPDNSSKRRLEDAENTLLEEMTQTATKFKKQKLDRDIAAQAAAAAAEEAAQSQALMDEEMPEQILEERTPGSKPDEARPLKPSAPKITFEEALRKTKKEQEEQYEYNTLGGGSGSAEALDEIQISELKNLAIVEDCIEILKPAPPSLSVAGQENLRSQWGGRPNFKKFRSARRNLPGINVSNMLAADKSHSTQAVIPQVMLVEVNPHQMRIQNDVEWLQNDCRRQPTPGSARAQVNEEGVEAGTAWAADEMEESLFMGSSEGESDDDEMSFRYSRTASRSASAKPSRGTTPAAAGSRQVKSKKAAAAVVVNLDSDDDDDDENGFAFKFSK